MQEMFYKKCFEMYSSRHRWIAFIDADEFIDTPGNETLREILESFDPDDHVGALGMNVSNNTATSLMRWAAVAQDPFLFAA